MEVGSLIFYIVCAIVVYGFIRLDLYHKEKIVELKSDNKLLLDGNDALRNKCTVLQKTLEDEKIKIGRIEDRNKYLDAKCHVIENKKNILKKIVSDKLNFSIEKTNKEICAFRYKDILFFIYDNQDSKYSYLYNNEKIISSKLLLKYEEDNMLEQTAVFNCYSYLKSNGYVNELNVTIDNFPFESKFWISLTDKARLYVEYILNRQQPVETLINYAQDTVFYKDPDELDNDNKPFSLQKAFELELARTDNKPITRLSFEGIEPQKK